VTAVDLYFAFSGSLEDAAIAINRLLGTQFMLDAFSYADRLPDESLVLDLDENTIAEDDADLHFTRYGFRIGVFSPSPPYDGARDRIGRSFYDQLVAAGYPAMLTFESYTKLAESPPPAATPAAKR
jgi:hypothetical protein